MRHNFPGLHNVVAFRPAFQSRWRAAAAQGIAMAKSEATNGYLYSVIGVEEPNGRGVASGGTDGVRAWHKTLDIPIPKRVWYVPAQLAVPMRAPSL